MDLEKYIEELDRDLRVDAFNIKDVQMALPSIKHKWVGRLIRHKQEVQALMKGREKVKRDLIHKLHQTSAVKLSDPAADRTIELSDFLKDHDQRIDNLRLIIELLEKTERVLSSMTYDIKNMIELIKLETT